MEELIEKLMDFSDVSEAPSEEILRDQEANILQLGEKLREEGKTKEMTDLIQKVRHFLRFMSKAKAAKLVRGLVDMFLEMERSDPRGEREVQLCKVRTCFCALNRNPNFMHLTYILEFCSLLATILKEDAQSRFSIAFFVNKVLLIAAWTWYLHFNFFIAIVKKIVF